MDVLAKAAIVDWIDWNHVAGAFATLDTCALLRSRRASLEHLQEHDTDCDVVVATHHLL